MENYTFDLGRILIGDTPPMLVVEIIFRTTIMFSYALLLFRLLGARALSQLSLGETVLIIGLGEAIGVPMFQPDEPLIHGMLVITVVIGLQWALSRLAMRVKPVQRVLEPGAIRLAHDGQIEERGLQKAGMTKHELYAELRHMDVENLADVKRAYLEPDGKISVFKESPAKGKGTDYDLIEDADQRKSA